MKNYQKINLLLLVLFSIISSCKKDNHEITPIILDNDTHIMFWCSEYISDSIIVECNGQTEKISVYYYSGEPNCSDANNATFDLTAGSYSYTASMGSTEWSGTITVSINECKKVDLSNIAPTTVSNADLIMGSFTGTGNFLPGQIFLGNQSGCTSVPYLSYLQSGLTTLNILKISDNTVSFSFTSNSFSPVLYSAVSIAKNGNLITFSGGTYNTVTKLFNFSGFTSNSSYMTSNACLIQLPYVFGYDVLMNGTYGYSTIEHLEFSGTKD